MKKIVALLVAAMLMLSAVSALAVDLTSTVDLSTTRSFVELLDRKEVEYTVTALKDGFEQITIENHDSDIDFDYVFRVFFDEDLDLVAIRLWDLAAFTAADLPKAYEVCNNLNSAYKYTCFYADTSDNTLSCKLDTVVTPNEDVGQITWEALMHICDIIEDSYPEFKVLNTK